MYRWNSRGYNGSSINNNTSNLSEFSSISVTARGWIWNALKKFFSLLSVFHLGRIIREVNPINYSTCFFPALSTSSFIFCSCFNTKGTNSSPSDNNTDTTNSSFTSCSSSCSSINNSNIPPAKNKQRVGKMAQILSKTMTLLGVAFVIHFIIMSTFAESEGYIHGYSAPDISSGRHHNTRQRQQRSFRSDKHTSSPEENTLAPPRIQNKSEAMFFTENSTIITAQIGSKTYLPCAVRNLGSGVASWIRRRDYHLLTVGMGTYSNDDRFVVSHNRAAQSWELHIKFVKPSDEGIYECQISTHPPTSIFIHLSVVEAKAEILGEPDKHVRSGSTFELVCVLRDSTEPPVYVFWYHNDRMINYDNARGVTVNSDTEKSILTIQDAQKEKGGVFSCVPSNARPTNISVHILNGEKPAAMQHGSRSHSGRQVGSSVCLLFVTAFAVFLLTTWLVTTNLNQNLYYLRQQDATVSGPKPIETNGKEEADVNLQIVQIAEISVEETSIHKHLQRLVEDKEGAWTDKDDIRFKKIPEAAFLKKTLTSSCEDLSFPRYYIMEVPYQYQHQQHQESHDIRTLSISTSSLTKNVADALEENSVLTISSIITTSPVSSISSRMSSKPSLQALSFVADFQSSFANSLVSLFTSLSNFCVTQNITSKFEPRPLSLPSGSNVVVVRSLYPNSVSR